MKLSVWAFYLGQSWRSGKPLSQGKGSCGTAAWYLISSIELLKMQIEDSRNDQHQRALTCMPLIHFHHELLTSSAVPATSKGGGLSGGAIAGIVIGCIAGLALLLGIVLLFVRRRRHIKVRKLSDDMFCDLKTSTILYCTTIQSFQHTVKHLIHIAGSPLI